MVIFNIYQYSQYTYQKNKFTFIPVLYKYHTECEFDKIVIIIIVKLRTFPRKQYQNGIAT